MLLFLMLVIKYWCQFIRDLGFKYQWVGLWLMMLVIGFLGFCECGGLTGKYLDIIT